MRPGKILLAFIVAVGVVGMLFGPAACHSVCDGRQYTTSVTEACELVDDRGRSQ